MTEPQGKKRSNSGSEIDLWRIARPLPSTLSILAALPSKPDKMPPFLKGILPEKKDQAPTANLDDTAIAAIDNRRNSTLTGDEHELYLKLQNENGFNTKGKRRLRTLVRAEQDTYRQARHQFLVDNSQRYMTGFAVPSEYATWHSEYTRGYIEQWKKENCPMEYGKVRQMIRLQQEGKVWMPNEVFESKVVVPVTFAPDLSTTLPDKRKGVAVVPPLLKNDAKALALAQEHGASTIVSSQFLEHVLTLEEWKVPVWNQGIRILDEPLPQPTLTRSCLTRGMEEALNESPSEFIYTLLTIIPKLRKILVRGQVTKSRAHLEYFPERGVEQLSSEEMALWILDSLVVKSPSQQLVRINVQNWSVMTREPVSVAHALASGNDVMKHWNDLLSLLSSLESMPTDDNYLLTCQGKTVSVHKANDHDVAIAMRDEFETADAVKTGSASLVECSRPWKWESTTRVEDTFPIGASEASTKKHQHN